MQLLHGDLEVQVVGGDDLADRDNALFHVIRGDWSDCWVEVSLGGVVILTTDVRNNVVRTLWGDRVTLPICQRADYLEIAVHDKDRLHSELVGRGKVLLGDKDKAWRRDGPVYLDGRKGRIDMKIGYTPASQVLEDGIEVPRAYFAMREGGSLTLYQDAHSTILPGTKEPTEGAFEAIANTIRKAKKFIYITGWSIWVGTRLQRDSTETLGELLTKKAAEGVRVLIMIWNEKFSAGLCAGLLGTHDKATEKYFRGTGVHVEMVRRMKGFFNIAKEELAEALWSHHQKVIVSDTGNEDKAGGLVAYFGGLDLTNGRWDTPEHQLFTTLSNEHKDDFYNNIIKVPADQGPREPWHDVHARVTGQAALDLLRNFEERWRKQAPKRADLLIPSLEEDLLPTPAAETDLRDVWQTQVVRSIDAESALFGGGRVGVLDAYQKKEVDSSLHRAVVRVIRRAQHFLYMESQYFIGSAQAWSEDQHVSARNLVPLEIAEKVVSKIRAGEGFRAYLVLPMIPEGNPSHKIQCCSMKAIMRWQFLTIEMIYKKIADALKEVGSDHHPTDYFLVLCLAKKESRILVSESPSVTTPKKGSEAWKWRQKSRFLIYVHSKMVLADDSHIFAGSANFNQRSLDGRRDTEIAVSACQIRRNRNEEWNLVTDGEVARFRRSLWAEHTGGVSEEEGVEGGALSNPGSLVAIRRIKELADDALTDYVSGNPDEEQRCRFLRYPLDVGQDGKLKAIPNLQNIPDFNIPVVGDKSHIPSIATT